MRFDYMLSEEARAELERLGIKFESIEGSDECQWPCIVLPSGILLVISKDDEGNGAGSIHEYGSIKEYVDFDRESDE